MRAPSRAGSAAGNRQAVTGTGATTYTMQPNGMNRYATAGAAVLTYDLRGNLASDGTRTMSYDAEDRLTSVSLAGTTVNYTYDWAHRRAQRSAAGSGVRYLYDEDWNVLCDLDAATGALLTRYVHGPGVDEVLSQQGATATYYLCRNHLGSTTALISATTNAVTERYTYEEYGAPTVRQASGYPSGSAPATRYLFTGREYDSTSGLYHYRHRWYHPGLGRWVSPDPIREEGGFNLYGYVLNDPINGNDSFGLAVDPPPEGDDPEYFEKDWKRAKQSAVDTACLAASFVPIGKAPKGYNFAKAYGGRFFQWIKTVPAKNAPGEAKVIWVKITDACGKTVRMYKDTISKDGRFWQRKVKWPREIPPTRTLDQ